MIEKVWLTWSDRYGEPINIVRSIVGNTYGFAQVWESVDGKCWFGIEGHNGLNGQECGRLFYESFKATWENREF